MPRKPANHQKPWFLLMEFPSHADAQAAKELLSEQFSEPVILRPKHQHPSDGNIASWRMTHILREELGNRTFSLEEVDAVLLAHHYNGKVNTNWLTAAVKHGVIERLRRGEYRFLLTSVVAKPDLDAMSYRDPQCVACQPEPLRCQP